MHSNEDDGSVENQQDERVLLGISAKKFVNSTSTDTLAFRF